MTLPCFIGNLRDRLIGRRVWVITDDTCFWSATGKVVEVEVGFILDYCSSPWWLWWCIPVRDDQYDYAAAVHDKAVRNRIALKLSLIDCHRLFLEALLARGVPRWKAMAMFNGVYLFNWMSPGKGDGSIPPSIQRRITISPF